MSAVDKHMEQGCTIAATQRVSFLASLRPDPDVRLHVGRRDEVDPSPRCCTGHDCLQRSRGRHAVITALRTDNYLPLLLVSTSACGGDFPAIVWRCSCHTLVHLNSNYRCNAYLSSRASM